VVKFPFLLAGFAGLAGGMAEVLGVLAYSAVTPLSAVEVARQVTTSVVPQAATSAAAPALGLAIHFGLSLLLAYGFVATLAYAGGAGASSRSQLVTTAVLALMGVWALNFLVLLPLVNLHFTTLMPFSVTLLSKVFFGAVMGGVLARPAMRTEGFSSPWSYSPSTASR
jgi:hypothetical protein